MSRPSNRRRERIKKGIADGKPLDTITSEKPTAEFDERWGKGFLKPDVFVKLLYQILSKG